MCNETKSVPGMRLFHGAAGQLRELMLAMQRHDADHVRFAVWDDESNLATFELRRIQDEPEDAAEQTAEEVAAAAEQTAKEMADAAQEESLRAERAKLRDEAIEGLRRLFALKARYTLAMVAGDTEAVRLVLDEMQELAQHARALRERARELRREAA